MTLTVGFVGLGTMGVGMARNLAKAGFPAGRRDADARARPRRSRASSAAPCGPPDRRKRSPARSRRRRLVPARRPRGRRGPPGRARDRPRSGRRERSSSTARRSRPEAARSIAERLAKAGVAFLDAPVSGGQKGAAEGTLTFFVGGDALALEKASLVLAAMGKRITHLGPSGAGQLGKATNQIVVAGNAGRRFGGHGVRAPRSGLPLAGRCTRRSWAARRARGCSTCSGRR